MDAGPTRGYFRAMTILGDSRPDSGPPTAAQGRVRLQTLVLIRWVALAGQTAAIVFVHLGLGYPMPFVLALAAVAASVALNIFLTLRYPPTTRLSDAQAAIYLAYDTVQLGVLLFLTGGVQNPFAILVLVPVTICASILSLRATVSLVLLAIAALSLIANYHLPLPWSMPGFALPPLYVTGMWIALALGAVFVTIYAWRVAAESRRMSDALAETQMALAKEQRLSALGTLAAAAAHELGTPLGTITVVAKELSRELPATGAVADDVRLLIAETQRCRDILAQLSRRPEGERDPHLHRLPAPALLDTIAAPHRRREGVVVTVETAPGRGLDGTTPPVLPHVPEIAHGLGNLVENAVDFARSRVTITVAWTAAELSIVLADDGPGFAQNILGELGEPYISSRSESGDGMGLGVFIAKTLLERTGARVSFANRREGGAQVAVTWPRSALDEAALSPA